MARKLDKQKAIDLRNKGYSYSQIKEELDISKSTLSGWLADMPLSSVRIKELRDFSSKRIENYRNTMQKKREAREKDVYQKISKIIGKISNKELFLSGLFLYWGEGSKTKNYSIALTNTNPNMLVFFIKWLESINVPKDKLKVNLHLYSDMDIEKQINFWSKTLDLKKSQFRRPYVKKTKLKSITYKNGFGNGTCSVIYEDRETALFVMMGLKYIQNLMFR